jgi:hypothetical protein
MPKAIPLVFGVCPPGQMAGMQAAEMTVTAEVASDGTFRSLVTQQVAEHNYMGITIGGGGIPVLVAAERPAEQAVVGRAGDSGGHCPSQPTNRFIPKVGTVQWATKLAPSVVVSTTPAPRDPTASVAPFNRAGFHT